MYSPFLLVTPTNWTQLWALLPRLRRRQVAGGVRSPEASGRRRRQVAGGVRLLKLSNLPMRITRSSAHSTFASLASLVMRWKEISLYSTNIRDWRFLQICRESLDIYLMDNKKKSIESVFCHGVLHGVLCKRCWQGSPEKDLCMSLWQRQCEV